MKRRAFIETMLAATAGIGLLSTWAAGKPTPKAIPRRPLGRTGHQVTLFSLGGQSTLEEAGHRDAALAIIHRALDLGVNYIDTAPSYGGGISETNIGQVMRERRNEVFLASKSHDRTYEGTKRLIEQSLHRLQTDRLDLYQLHNVRTQDDLDRIFSRNGALRAMENLRDEGVIRRIGITGHRDPEVLRRGILMYEFDCILMSLNAADIHHAPFQTTLLDAAVAKNMGIIAMKVPARGRIFRPDGLTRMRDALDYVFSMPISTAIVGISTLEQLEENVRIASAHTPLEQEEKARIEKLTAHYHADASWFKYRW
jgi:aryl-alcohol dehydrogenase-like predicted oxidoreductase